MAQHLSSRKPASSETLVPGDPRPGAGVAVAAAHRRQPGRRGPVVAGVLTPPCGPGPRRPASPDPPAAGNQRSCGCASSLQH